MKNPYNIDGIASKHKVVLASPGCPLVLNQMLPNITAANIINIISHKPMLPEETVPSPRPSKKKYRTISETRASIAHSILKNIMLIPCCSY